MQGATAQGIRIEVVTTSFVAAGRPAGMADFDRLMENLNNPAIARHIELASATVRPLYRAASPLAIDSPLLVKRDEIVFATFEGPATESSRAGDVAATPCLMLLPPFQIQGDVAMPTEADRTQALRSLTDGFFAMLDARVYDADGYLLGEGERIVVNGAAVQMAAATKRHIEAFAEQAGAVRRARRTETDMTHDAVDDRIVSQAA
jgi:hypothetical protein